MQNETLQIEHEFVQAAVAQSLGSAQSDIPGRDLSIM